VLFIHSVFYKDGRRLPHRFSQNLHGFHQETGRLNTLRAGDRLQKEIAIRLWF